MPYYQGIWYERDIAFLEVGDVVCTASHALLARSIRWLLKKPTSHTGIIAQDGPADNTLIIEHTERGLAKRDFLAYHKNDMVWVYRPNLARHLKVGIVQDLEKELGEPYGFLEFIPQALDGLLFPGSEVFRKLLPLIPGSQCSSAIALAMKNWSDTKVNGVSAASVTPGDWMDYALSANFTCVLSEKLGSYVAERTR